MRFLVGTIGERTGAWITEVSFVAKAEKRQDNRRRLTKATRSPSLSSPIGSFLQRQSFRSSKANAR